MHVKALNLRGTSAKDYARVYRIFVCSRHGELQLDAAPLDNDWRGSSCECPPDHKQRFWQRCYRGPGRKRIDTRTAHSFGTRPTDIGRALMIVPASVKVRLAPGHDPDA
jgi:hypothetical protein